MLQLKNIHSRLHMQLQYFLFLFTTHWSCHLPSHIDTVTRALESITSTSTDTRYRSFAANALNHFSSEFYSAEKYKTKEYSITTKYDPSEYCHDKCYIIITVTNRITAHH